jgi:1,4-dihydroxy-2-naphthoate octaprenyltransferase
MVNSLNSSLLITSNPEEKVPFYIMDRLYQVSLRSGLERFLRGIIFAMAESPSNQFHIWLLAIRPKTLPAAVGPVIVGSALAYADLGFRFGPAFACFLAAILLQIGSNLANDVFDFEKGADQGERFGPTRVTQAGLLKPADVKRGMVLVFFLSAIFGLYLTIIGGWPILLVGVAAILSAIAYTGGPFPLGYHGLGDIFVFIFFGFAAVAGTYYVQTQTISANVWWMAVVMGLLTVAILVVNNLRDIENDRQVNKHTLAVRFGESFSRQEYVLCILTAYIIPVMLWIRGNLPITSLLIFLTLPMTFRLIKTIYADSGRSLNKTLAGTSRLELLYALCFALGLIVDSVIN